jgi:hypothetical protein
MNEHVKKKRKEELEGLASYSSETMCKKRMRNYNEY